MSTMLIRIFLGSTTFCDPLIASCWGTFLTKNHDKLLKNIDHVLQKCDHVSQKISHVMKKCDHEIKIDKFEEVNSIHFI